MSAGPPRDRLPPNWEDWPPQGRAAWLSLHYDRAELVGAVASAAGLDLDREPSGDTRFRVGELALILIAMESDGSMSDHLNP